MHLIETFCGISADRQLAEACALAVADAALIL